VTRSLLLALVLVLGLAVLPATAEEGPESVVDCGTDASYERLSADGFAWDVAAPAGFPDPGAVRDESEGRTIALRSSHYYLQAELAPFERAPVTLDLEWVDGGDFDLEVYDHRGFAIGVSQAEDVVGEASERVTVTLRHCQQVHVLIRNYTGIPGHPLSLSATVGEGTGALACVAGDPAPACDGVEAGDLPAPAGADSDTRTFHYLAGAPGQLSMVSDTVAEEGNPLVPGTSQDRPSGTIPNAYTRPVGGFNDQSRNPFIAWFPVDGDRQLTGDASALVYVSSPTLAGDADAGIDPGTLEVDLWSDGALLASVEVPGDQVRDVPTPIFVTFPDLDRRVRSGLHLQIGTTPAASSNGPGEPGNATHTVWYDSVQFPSRLTLP
jgi:hypothetical protein